MKNYSNVRHKYVYYFLKGWIVSTIMNRLFFYIRPALVFLGVNRAIEECGYIRGVLL
jgi:hypothetical protein